MPLVYVAVFIEHPTPFMEEFLDRLTTLNYPTARIRLFIHNNVRHRAKDADVESDMNTNRPHEVRVEVKSQ